MVWRALAEDLGIDIVMFFSDFIVSGFIDLIKYYFGDYTTVQNKII